jgi:hypothetical protein
LAAASPQLGGYPVKLPLGRVVGFTVLSFGSYMFWWLHTVRRQLDQQIADGRDDATMHTVGFIVPILNWFVVYWLWRDLNYLRARVGLPEFPVAGYLVGSILGLSIVFFPIVANELEQYWDRSTGGRAVYAPVTGIEKILVGVGIAIWSLFVLTFLALIVILIVAGASA